MKKRLFLLALSAAMPALAQEKAPNPPRISAPTNVAPVPDSAPFQWRLRLRAGQKFLTTAETSTQTSQQMPALPGAPKTGELSSDSQSRTVIEQNVLSVDEKGARVEVIYREMTQSLTTRQGDKVVYDSANPPPEMKGLADLSKSIVGTRLSFTLSPQGEISDIGGVEASLERLNAGLEKAAQQTPALVAQQKAMRETLAGLVSPDAVKSAMGAAYRAMPAKAMARGESWNYIFTLPIRGTSFTHNGQGTFVSRARGIVTLAQKGASSTDAGAEFKIPLSPSRDPKDAAPITQLDMRGTSTGEILVDEQSGMTLQSRTKESREGELIISGMTGRGSVLSIPMKIKVETTSKTVELKTTP